MMSRTSKDEHLAAVPVAHISDPAAVQRLLEALGRIHGPEYAFSAGRWDGPTVLRAASGQRVYRFIVEADGAAVQLSPGDVVRGMPPAGPYREDEAPFAVAERAAQEALWPGDVVTLAGDESLEVQGRAVFFEVAAALTEYRAPKVAFLRYLPDRPGGCAAYEGAFRREALPPQRSEDAQDARGANRVNEHTLDMRPDRTPLPQAHYHGIVPTGAGRYVNHSETAIVLPRSVYGLPDPGESQRVVLFRRPAEDPGDTYTLPVTPGTIVVTPATDAGVVGHRFENAFAMLIAIPGFVSPAHRIEPGPA